jgi:hypothetical protein
MLLSGVQAVPTAAVAAAAAVKEQENPSVAL